MVMCLFHIFAWTSKNVSFSHLVARTDKNEEKKKKKMLMVCVDRWLIYFGRRKTFCTEIPNRSGQFKWNLIAIFPTVVSVGAVSIVYGASQVSQLSSPIPFVCMCVCVCVLQTLIMCKTLGLFFHVYYSFYYIVFVHLTLFLYFFYLHSMFFPFILFLFITEQLFRKKTFEKHSRRIISRLKHSNFSRKYIIYCCCCCCATTFFISDSRNSGY